MKSWKDIKRGDKFYRVESYKTFEGITLPMIVTVVASSDYCDTLISQTGTSFHKAIEYPSYNCEILKVLYIDDENSDSLYNTYFTTKEAANTECYNRYSKEIEKYEDTIKKMQTCVDAMKMNLRAFENK